MDGRRIKKWDGEASTHERVVQYLRTHYPNVIFRTDYAAGIQLPIWLARRQKALQFRRGFPDIFIYFPSVIRGLVYNGLALELKAKDVAIVRKNGNWAQEHYKEQYEMLRLLKAAGYAASFSVGYEEATHVIDWYLAAQDSDRPDIAFDEHLLPIVASMPTLEDEGIF